MAPAVSGEHCVGASFSPGDESREVRVGDHAANLAALADALPAWRDALAGLDPASLAGRAEVRCVSPDYLPMVGPLPDVPRFRARFAALASDAGSVIERRGAFLHGLYLSTAHGSRGLSYAALAAEVIASHACYEAPPLPRQLMRAIAPARFTIRSLIRGTA